MKTIHLNLAKRPYRDYRPVYGTLALLALATIVLMIYNIVTAQRYLLNTQKTRATIASTEAAVLREQKATQSVQASLKGVDTAALNQETRFINAQLAERAFSWSALLDQLERVFPQDVRLISLAPKIDKNRNTSLDMACVSKSSDGMVRLVNRLITDRHFARPFPHSETISNGEYMFTLTTEYRPDAYTVEATP